MPVFAQEPDMSLIPYRKGDLWGYASPDKNIAIKPEYEEANLFYEGFAVVKKGGKYGYINKDGKVVIPIKFSPLSLFVLVFMGLIQNQIRKIKHREYTKNGIICRRFATTNGYEICIDTKGRSIG